MDKKRAYVLGQRAGLAKVASALQAKKPMLVKLAKALNALERRGKLTKAAADAIFEKKAIAPALLALLAGGGGAAAPHVWRGLKGFWGGLTGGGAKPGAAAAAEPGAAGAEAPTGKMGPATGEVTDKGMAGQMQRYMGMSPAALSQMQASQAGMLGRTLPYRQMAGTMRGMFGAM